MSADIDENGLGIKILSTTNRREALNGAKYVVNSVRIGGLEAFEKDVEIPLKYGVDQCVGDTLCIGGIMYGQRVIAAMMDFCRICARCALRMCCTSTIQTRTRCGDLGMQSIRKVNTIGLCHGEMHGEEQIAEVLGYNKKDLDFIYVRESTIRHGIFRSSIKEES